MRALLVAACLAALGPAALGQPLSTEYLTALAAERADTDARFRDADRSPLDAPARAAFAGIPYYAAGPAFVVPATFEAGRRVVPYHLERSQGPPVAYGKRGVLRFVLHADTLRLAVFEDEADGETTYLVPFRDATSGTTTYGAGRYLTLDALPADGDTVTLDFNRAYNPYCAYSPQFTCPIPPVENHLDVPIEAGARYTPVAAEPFVSEAGRFSVAFPKPPVQQVRTNQTELGPIDIALFLVETDSAAFVVSYYDVPGGVADTADVAAFLALERQAMVEGQGATLLEHVAPVQPDLAGLAFRSERDGFEFRAELYLVGDRRYSVIVGRPTGASREGDDAFLASFRPDTAGVRPPVEATLAALGYSFEALEGGEYRLLFGVDGGRNQMVFLTPVRPEVAAAGYEVWAPFHVSAETPPAALLLAALEASGQNAAGAFRAARFQGEDRYTYYFSVLVPAGAPPALLDGAMAFVLQTADAAEQEWNGGDEF